MTVWFETSVGSVYAIDHNLNTFTQEAPVKRTGSLANKPVVREGQRVEIWTATPGQTPRVIITAPVVSRQVLLG